VNWAIFWSKVLNLLRAYLSEAVEVVPQGIKNGLTLKVLFYITGVSK